MRIFGRDVPCGCEARKEIMFTEGQLGVREAAAVVLIIATITVAWRYRVHA